MGASTIPEIPKEVSRHILCSEKPFGQFDLGDKKYVFSPNNNNVDELKNPTHLVDLGRKIGMLVGEKKISFLTKVYFSGGIIRTEGGATTISIYRIASRYPPGGSEGAKLLPGLT